MDKIKGIREIAKLSKNLKRHGKKVALITGCFDILHIGHIQLFRFAKNSADILIVGLENDETIRRSKGDNRPIHKLRERCDVLSDISSIDYIFKIKKVINFGTNAADATYARIAKTIRPDYLVTYAIADKFWRKKKARAQKIGSALLVFKPKRRAKTSTTSIIDKLNKED